MRKRRCFYCPEHAVIADQVAHPAVTIKLDGSIERFTEWKSRYLCTAHEHLDPWAS